MTNTNTYINTFPPNTIRRQFSVPNTCCVFYRNPFCRLHTPFPPLSPPPPPFPCLSPLFFPPPFFFTPGCFSFVATTVTHPKFCSHPAIVFCVQNTVELWPSRIWGQILRDFGIEGLVGVDADVYHHFEHISQESHIITPHIFLTGF